MSKLRKLLLIPILSTLLLGCSSESDESTQTTDPNKDVVVEDTMEDQAIIKILLPTDFIKTIKTNDYKIYIVDDSYRIIADGIEYVTSASNVWIERNDTGQPITDLNIIE